MSITIRIKNSNTRRNKQGEIVRKSISQIREEKKDIINEIRGLVKKGSNDTSVKRSN